MVIMRDWAVAITLIGVSIIVTVVMVGLCRLLGGWTWLITWMTGSKEETVQLTKSEFQGNNGYMVNSDSSVVLDISGQYKRYDQLSKDMRFLDEPSKNKADTNVAVDPLTITKRPSVGDILQRRHSLGGASPDNELPDALCFESSPSAPLLQRAMSCDSVSSDTSVVLEALESPQYSGEVEIGLEYDNETEDLIVVVNQARGLVGPDPNVVVDSYIRVFLLPDKTTNMQTRLQKKTNDPVFKERFLFGVDRMELGQRSILCYVYTSDKYTNTIIGEAEIKLCDIDLRGPSVSWVPIIDSNQKTTELGDLMFSISYLPTAERLTIVVVKARNLMWPSGNALGDPFIKVYVLQNGKKISKKKTSLKKSENNPIFNEAMIFSVPSHALQNIQVRLTVVDHQQDGRAPAVGHVFVGPHCTGKSLSHWNQMMSSLRKPIAMWHPLRK